MENCELFIYTSGGWLYNDSIRRAERYVPFDVGELKRVAAESIGKQIEDVVGVRKLAEGGFNRVFEIMMKNETRIIARLPYPITIPEHLTIASEVATMDLVRSFNVPVPRVYGYCTTKNNPVGVEYILMEPVNGRNLDELWFSLSENERIKVVFEIVKLEAILFSINLPGSGSIYYVDDLDATLGRIKISNHQTKGRPLCIGPDTSLPFWFGQRSFLPIDRGPYTCSEQVVKAGAQKELAYLQRYGRPRHPIQSFRRETYGYEKQSPDHHCENLHNLLKIADYLVPRTEILNRPTIRHPDLRPGNIFVSETLEITGLIDWQHAVVLPLFLQCRLPKDFQNYGDEISESLVIPRLPTNFAELDSTTQARELELFRRRHLHFYYLAATSKYNELHYDSLTWDCGVLRQKLYTHASEPWEGDNVTLKADLIQAGQYWQSIIAEAHDERHASFPLSYSREDTEETLRLHADQMDADASMERVSDIIGVGPEGWVPVEHLEDTRLRHGKFVEQVLEEAEDENERKRIQEHWPFRDHDEE